MQKNLTSVELYLEALRLIEEDITTSGHFSGYYSRRIYACANVAIYVRRHQPSGGKGIAFEVSPEIVKSLKLSQTTKGFSVSTELDINTDGRKICRVSISIGDPAFEELFTELVGHLLDHILGATSEKDAILSLQSQLLLWRKFLDRGANEGLSEKEQIGLYGELSFLKLCINSGVPAMDALNAWTGPSAENQDFMFGACAVEVKSSAANDANRIQVSNTRQLDDTGLKSLFLHHYALDRRKSSGETLPQLINILTELIKEQDTALPVLFDELLIAAGYLHAHHALYSEAGYALRYENTYLVDENFPRILEASLPCGLSDVKFIVDLASISGQRTDKEEIFKALGYSST